jgi:hypothetical protein
MESIHGYYSHSYHLAHVFGLHQNTMNFWVAAFVNAEVNQPLGTCRYDESAQKACTEICNTSVQVLTNLACFRPTSQLSLHHILLEQRLHSLKTHCERCVFLICLGVHLPGTVACMCLITYFNVFVLGMMLDDQMLWSAIQNHNHARTVHGFFSQELVQNALTRIGCQHLSALTNKTLTIPVVENFQ